MSDEKLGYRYEQYKKALGRLKEVAEEGNDDKNIVADATIQRFEFTLELAWKLLKAYLESQGSQSVYSPLDTVKEAFSLKVITDGDVWAEMLRKRNLTSHTYDAPVAEKIYEEIREKYIPRFEELEGYLADKV